MKLTPQQRALALFIGALSLLGAVGIVTAQPTRWEWEKHLVTSEKRDDQVNNLQDKISGFEQRFKNLEAGQARIEQAIEKLDSSKSWATLVAALLGGSGLTFGFTAKKRHAS